MAGADDGPGLAELDEVLSLRRAAGVKDVASVDAQSLELVPRRRPSVPELVRDTVRYDMDVLDGERARDLLRREPRWADHRRCSTCRRHGMTGKGSLIGEAQWWQIMDREHLRPSRWREPEIEPMHHVGSRVGQETDRGSKSDGKTTGQSGRKAVGCVIICPSTNRPGTDLPLGCTQLADGESELSFVDLLAHQERAVAVHPGDRSHPETLPPSEVSPSR